MNLNPRYYTCGRCGASFSGAHACQSAPSLTEADVRRIVREELAAAKGAQP
jgi:hypothetical protein